jgi:CDP-glucose 4,6-dehydratase
VRRPETIRPWQHILEPLGGYLLLAEELAIGGEAFSSAFDFGPALEANCSVKDLVEAAVGHWPGSWLDLSDPTGPHKAGLLHLQIDMSHHQLGWRPRWTFATTVELTVGWYRALDQGANASCMPDLEAYEGNTIVEMPAAQSQGATSALSERC